MKVYFATIVAGYDKDQVKLSWGYRTSFQAKMALLAELEKDWIEGMGGLHDFYLGFPRNMVTGATVTEHEASDDWDHFAE